MKTFRDRLLRVCFEVMKPLAKCLLNCGVGYTEFSELSKRAFVDVAAQEFGLRGRPANVSRVSTMTGLSRREVRRLLKLDHAVYKATVTSMRSPAADVLHFWHQDSEFLDSTGTPMPLHFDGDGSTFSLLVRRYGGDRPPGALRNELKRVGAISESDDGLIRVLKRYFVPSEREEKLLLSMAQNLRALTSTIAHNSTRGELEEGRIERCVYTALSNSRSLELFKRLARERIIEFTEEVDNEIAVLEADEDPIGGSTRTVGIGVFYFEDRGSASGDQADSPVIPA